MNEKNLKTNPNSAPDTEDESNDAVAELPPEVAEAIDTLMQGVISDEEIIEIAERHNDTEFSGDCLRLIENVLDLKMRLLYLGALFINLNAMLEEDNGENKDDDNVETYADHINFNNINWGTPA